VGVGDEGDSSRALRDNYAENRKKFNGIEYTSEFDLIFYETFYRTLDPQTGRFFQIDPKVESAEAWSPFSAMLNNPILNADPLGDSSIKPGLTQAQLDEMQRKLGKVRNFGEDEGDQIGTIRKATNNDYHADFWGALSKDIIYWTAEFTGLNAVIIHLRYWLIQMWQQATKLSLCLNWGFSYLVFVAVVVSPDLFARGITMDCQ
jgi:RHS repeat-associated protein